MGWASGSTLFNEIIEIIKEHVVDEDERVEVYKRLIEAFEDSDWDTQDECLGEDSAYDEALKELHLDWYDNEEENEE